MVGTLRTVTLNSGFDVVYEVAGLRWGGVGQVLRRRQLASGKGVNAARSAAALGVPVRAYALVGAEDLAEFAAGLDCERIEHHLVPVPGPLRRNLTVVPRDEGLVAAHFVAPGLRLDGPAQVEPLVSALVADCRPSDLVTLNGSLPRGLPATIWAEIADRVRGTGVEVAIDVQGEAMLRALSGGPVLFAKPNDEEAVVLADSGAREALRVLADFGVRYPLVSLGQAGALYLQDGQVRRAWCPVERPVAAVAAGDAFLAGFAAAYLRGERGADGLIAAALSAGAAHVAGLRGSEFADAWGANLERVVTDP